ncbi:protein MULTIPLE CHLOROPLAST DIVISION SITE 1 [Momordica charantia]|uniref:Protein MULTIPLE CHLOROPLAST DIVISION SITE 1 n=1 Tax=Momordica charantia TaxID=3673 RepID=A0A6J1C3I1_MOMCH|nr:protein MULTIPLE CHLOROPLAST DIVISION SITE 1 [Momordica charantia]
MASNCAVQLHSVSFQPSVSVRKPPALSGIFGYECTGISYRHLNCNWNRHRMGCKFLIRAAEGSASSDSGQNVEEDEMVVKTGTGSVASKDYIGKMQEMINSSPAGIFLMSKCTGNGLAIGFCVATACLAIIARVYLMGKSRNSHSGSVADLVRRGQLRSDRRGISKPLKYNDPFNNPLVKVDKSNSSVEMCGKVYRLAPVTLTKEEQNIHQKRRSRAYQWKRPTMFLKEGDSIPPDVDPETIRWIPANHPFATTASDIDEDLAQNNVYQKHGVPFRIQAEHEALQRKLEALQSEQKLNNLFIDPGSVKDFERPFKSKSKSDEQVEQSFSDHQAGELKPPNSGHLPSSLGVQSTSDEAEKS